MLNPSKNILSVVVLALPLSAFAGVFLSKDHVEKVSNDIAKTSSLSIEDIREAKPIDMQEQQKNEQQQKQEERSVYPNANTTKLP